MANIYIEIVRCICCSEAALGKCFMRFYTLTWEDRNVDLEQLYRKYSREETVILVNVNYMRENLRCSSISVIVKIVH